MKLWDVERRAPSRTLAGHSDNVLEVAFSRDGKTLISAGLDYTIGFWPVERLGEATELGVDDRKGQVAFADNTTVALFREGKVRLSDLATGQERTTVPHASEQAQYIAVSTKEVLAVKATDAIELWNVANMTRESLPSDPEFIVPDAGTPLVFSRNGQVL